MQITFISSLDIRKFFVMNSKSDNVKIMMGTETDEIIIIHWLHVVHLIHQKTNGVTTEETTVWKCFVKN